MNHLRRMYIPKLHAAQYVYGMPVLPPVSDALKRAFAQARFVEAAAEAWTLSGSLGTCQDRHCAFLLSRAFAGRNAAHWQNDPAWSQGRKGMHDQVIARSNHLHDPSIHGTPGFSRPSRGGHHWHGDGHAQQRTGHLRNGTEQRRPRRPLDVRNRPTTRASPKDVVACCVTGERLAIWWR